MKRSLTYKFKTILNFRKNDFPCLGQISTQYYGLSLLIKIKDFGEDVLFAADGLCPRADSNLKRQPFVRIPAFSASPI